MLNRTYLKELQLLKENYKEDLVLVLGGLVFSLGPTAIWSIFLKTGLINYDVFSSYIFISIIVAAIGLLDDIAGSRNSQGLKGHFSKLLEGKLTTGIMKVIFIVLTAFLLTLREGLLSPEEMFLNSGIIILMTNFLNLLDLRPGRSIKFFLIVSFLIINRANNWLYFLPYYLLILPYLSFELRGRVMLGDGGANLLGFVLGYNLVNSIESFIGKYMIFLLLFFLTILSEFCSYSSLIKQNSFLSWLDRLGRGDCEI